MIPRIALMAAAALSMSACSTAARTVYAANIVDTSPAPLRTLIRDYVRDTVGPDYIVDVDELSRLGQMTARDRGTPPGLNRLSLPDVTFNLELVNGQCQLVPPAEMRDAPVLVLPANVRCEALDEVVVVTP